MTLQNMRQVAEEVWHAARDHRVWALHGSMGAGKTSFVHAVCRWKQVNDTVGSPTFSIINEYAYDQGGAQRKIYHIDLYRIRDEREAVMAGVEDCLHSEEYCLVEWPEKAPGLFPPDTLHIYIDVVNEGTRRVRIGE